MTSLKTHLDYHLDDVSSILLPHVTGIIYCYATYFAFSVKNNAGGGSFGLLTTTDWDHAI